MHIGIDISQIVYKGSGVARYTNNLVNALLENDHHNTYTFFFSSLRQKLNAKIENKIRERHKLKTYPFPPTLLSFMWNTLHVFPIDHLLGKVDLFLSSDWTESPSHVPKLTVVHDLVFVKYPETLPPSIITTQRKRMKWVKQESSCIVTDSISTKQDLIQLLQIDKQRIKVVYPFVSTQKPDVLTIQKTIKRYHLHASFILTVGKLEPRKNLARLIEAFMMAQLKETELVIVGERGWGTGPISAPSQVRFLGFLSDEELYSLYRSALFFVYPSLYEGFGYPIIEAMSLDCPVTTSNTSSLKEIGEGAALLFDPHDTDSISHSLKRLFTDPMLRTELIQKGTQKAAQFTMQKFARDLTRVFKDTYDHRR